MIEMLAMRDADGREGAHVYFVHNNNQCIHSRVLCVHGCLSTASHVVGGFTQDVSPCPSRV